ncbi:MAG TPA: cob(I)yrinic acid a,c-diamide adenosyltransferase [Cyclobacteriaceae bacterium]|nr:cob(I)yrinic acid a,c-diamide adenosyltransferase [Cyclobacteriaceae bacterium]
MKIYTKTGDDGSTSLYGGKRVSKAVLRIETYGTVDELNSWMGLLRDQEVNRRREAVLVSIQERLFVIGSMLAADPGNDRIKIPKLNEQDITTLEHEIDQMEKDLEPMRHFILPGGHQCVSFCHITRTVCRRAERLVIRLNTEETINGLVTKYLNRLSDFLFVLARKMGAELNANETPWIPEKS